MKYKKQVIIITGAANGIGQALAYGYANEKATVIIADIDEQKGRAIEKEILERGDNALFIKADVRKEHDIIHLMKEVYQRYGNIHILINNAGKGLFSSPFEVSLEQWNDVISTNLTSVFLCTKEAAKYMKEGSSIVNLASTRAIMSEPNSEAYAASKGGIVSLTHAFAASLAEKKIRVNAISPGWIETGNYEGLREIDHKQHFSQRVGNPNDILQACLFLTSKGNDFVTGTNLVVDGGMTKKMMYEE